jgi:hypothetical protein
MLTSNTLMRAVGTLAKTGKIKSNYILIINCTSMRDARNRDTVKFAKYLCGGGTSTRHLTPYEVKGNPAKFVNPNCDIPSAS